MSEIIVLLKNNVLSHILVLEEQRIVLFPINDIVFVIRYIYLSKTLESSYLLSLISFLFFFFFFYLFIT